MTVRRGANPMPLTTTSSRSTRSACGLTETTGALAAPAPVGTAMATSTPPMMATPLMIAEARRLLAPMGTLPARRSVVVDDREHGVAVGDRRVLRCVDGDEQRLGALVRPVAEDHHRDVADGLAGRDRERAGGVDVVAPGARRELVGREADGDREPRLGAQADRHLGEAHPVLLLHRRVADLRRRGLRVV